MEKKQKSREWVKTAAIIFLSILLVLTFFSNTIMNRTLTEVATAEVSSGSITPKIRGTGTVTAIGNTQIKSTCTTTVASVKVKSGQEVNEGDVLIIMGEQSEELETAEQELQNLEYQLMSANASAPIDTTSIELESAYDAAMQADAALADAEAKYEASLDPDNEVASSIWSEYREAKEKYNNAQAIYNNLYSELTELRGTLADDYAKKQAELDASDPSTDPDWQTKYDNADAAKKAYEKTFTDECTVYTEMVAAQKDAEMYSGKMTMYSSQLGQFKTDYDSAVSSAKSAWAKYESLLESSQLDYAKANQSAYSSYVNIAQIQAKIEKQKEKVNQLRGGEDNAITAPVSGTITSVDVSSGSSVAKGDVLCSIEVADMGYTVSFDVTNDQAKRLKVGDTATVSNYYWGSEITATISSIKVSSKSPQTKKTITFDLDGNVSSGSELTIAVGQKSASYDVVVPSSAVRSDANGNFVLRIKSKNSALGNRYFVERVSIEQLATDDVSTAISGDISTGDFVVTTSSAPIKSGEQVRMADN